MRSQKQSKTVLTTNSRLAHDFMVQTQMCQSAVKDLKQLLRRSKIQKEIPSSSDVMTKKLPIPTIAREAPPLDNHKEDPERWNSCFKMQNGRDYHLEVHTTEPNSILERLCRIGEEVDEFLRLSEGFIKRPKKRRRSRQTSVWDAENQGENSCLKDAHLDGNCENSNGPQYFEMHDEKADEPFVEQKACTSEGMDKSEEHAKQDEPVEECQEQGEPILEVDLEEETWKEDSESEDDEFKELWREAEFYRNCLLQEQREEQSDLSAAKEGCRHNFFFKADVGLVCDACGLIGKDIEAIFNFTWGNESRSHDFKKGESNNAGVFKVPIPAVSKEEGDDVLEQAAGDEQKQECLFLHSRFRAEMHEHQIEGFKFLEENIVKGDQGGCILAHAPGTGKTFLTIAFIHSFLQAYSDKRVMILAPKGMLLPWVREFRKWKVDIPLLNLYESSCSLQLTKDIADYGIWNDHNPATQLKLSHLQRVKEWQMTKSILLISYHHFCSLVNHQSGDALTMEVKRLLLEVPSLLILDEGHISRNSATVILKCLSDVSTKKRIMLSGTLFQNNFEEMYNLFKLVRPNFMRAKTDRLKGFLKSLFDGQGDRMHSKLFDVKLNGKKQPEEVAEQRIFVNCLCEKVETGAEEEQKEALELLHELMAPFVHWHKGKVLEGLPGLTDFTIFLNLTAAQEAAFATLKSQVLNTMERERHSALANVHPVLLMMKHPKQAPQIKEDSEPNVEKMDHNVDGILDRNSLSMMSECDPTHGCKAMFVLDVVALCGLQEKVLIFSQNLAPLTLLQKLFWKLWGWCDNQQVLRLDGDISSESRERIINTFNKSKDSRVMLASIKACGEGVSLVGASRVVFLDMNWNPAVTQQAISRAFRLGQNKRVYAYRLVGTGTLDEEIERVASRKEWLAAMISHASSKSQFEIGSEVDLQMEDRLFESAELRRQVAKCCRKAPDTLAL